MPLWPCSARIPSHPSGAQGWRKRGPCNSRSQTCVRHKLGMLPTHCTSSGPCSEDLMIHVGITLKKKIKAIQPKFKALCSCRNPPEICTAVLHFHLVQYHTTSYTICHFRLLLLFSVFNQSICAWDQWCVSIVCSQKCLIVSSC